MKVIKYTTFEELQTALKEYPDIIIIDDNGISYSFSIFVNKQRTELHIYYK